MILLVIAISCEFATCKKNVDCKQIVYSFSGNYVAYPDVDSIKADDTIWIDLEIPTQLQDIGANKLIDFSGAANFGPSIQFLEFSGGDLSNPGAKPAANLFENKLVIGTTISSDRPELVRGFKCKEEAGVYWFKLGVIPKKKGLFAIGVSDAVGVYRLQNECEKAMYNLSFKNTNQHLYLYEQSRPGYTPSAYERSHLYCFKVY